MTLLNRLPYHLSHKVHGAYSMRLFSILVYLWFIINAFMFWHVRDLVWGPRNIFFRQGHADGIVENFFYQLVYDAHRFHLIFYSHLVCAFISLFERKWSFIPRIITWATGLMLYYAAVEAFNSGMLLMLLMACYSSVVYTKEASSLRNVMTNLARIACIVQLVLVYFVATVYKVAGDQWLAGNAMYYTLHIDHFSSGFWQRGNLLRAALPMHTLTWLALAYQLLFPMMISWKKARKWWLAIGILFHLFIGIFMHLWDFALAMMFCYALFTSEEIAKKMMPFRTLRNKKPAAPLAP
jgi:hypothetical protein